MNVNHLNMIIWYVDICCVKIPLIYLLCFLFEDINRGCRVMRFLLCTLFLLIYCCFGGISVDLQLRSDSFHVAISSKSLVCQPASHRHWPMGHDDLGLGGFRTYLIHQHTPTVTVAEDDLKCNCGWRRFEVEMSWVADGVWMDSCCYWAWRSEIIEFHYCAHLLHCTWCEYAPIRCCGVVVYLHSVTVLCSGLWSRFSATRLQFST